MQSLRAATPPPRRATVMSANGGVAPAAAPPSSAAPPSQRASPAPSARRPPPPPRPLIVGFDLDATVWYPEMYQLWGGAPFTRCPKTGRVADRNGERLELMHHAPLVLQMLAAARGGGGGGGEKDDDADDEEEEEEEEEADDDPVLSWRGWEGTEVAYVSRTEHADWAEDALRAFTFPLDGGGQASSSPQKRRDRRAARQHPRGGGHGVPHLHGLASHREIYPGSKVAHFRRIRERSGVAYGDILFFDNERVNVVEVGRLGVVSVHCPRGLTREAWEEGVRRFAESKGAAAGAEVKGAGAAAAAAATGGAGSGARRKHKK